MEAAQLSLVLRNARLDEVVDTTLREWDGSDDAMIKRTVKWVKGLADEFLSLANEIQDPDEIRTSIAIQYIELKSRWIALNTKVNYQTFRNGACNKEDGFRASGISQLLAIIEPLIPQEDIDNITQFLCNPVRQAA